MNARKLVALGILAMVLIAVPIRLASSSANPFDVLSDPGQAGSVHRRARLDRGPPAPPPVAARVTLGAPGPAVPSSFLGLSMEYWGVPLFAAQPRALARVIAGLHVAGDGPLTIRIGGDSADQSLWDPPAHAPRWVFRLSRSFLDDANALLARVPARLILDLNLVTASAVQATSWAHAALSGLRRRSVSAFEIGNEPDLYDRSYWLATIARTGVVLPAAISPHSYLRAFETYARALGRIAPGIPLMGPAVARPTDSLAWIRLLATNARSRLGALTAHRYPYSACAGPGSAAYPTVDRILSDRAVGAIVRAVRPAVRVAHAAGLPFRLTELNSVTCGGRPRVSDTFATALWAPDALFGLLGAGVDSVDVHVRARTINAAFVPAAGGIAARPLLYGLSLFTRAIVPGGHMIVARVSAPLPARLHAWAIGTRAGSVRIVLVNTGRRAVWARLPARLSGGSVYRLTAPSAAARQGERLAGQWLDRTGRWRGAPRVQHLPSRTVFVPGDSAALVVG